MKINSVRPQRQRWLVWLGQLSQRQMHLMQNEHSYYPETGDDSSTGTYWKLQKNCRKSTLQVAEVAKPYLPTLQNLSKNIRENGIKHKGSIRLIFPSASCFHKQPNLAACFVKMNSC